MPRAKGVRGAAGSSVGWSSWSIDSGSMRPTACARSISPSSTISQAALSAAFAVRLAARVCSIQSVPDWTVNSMSCMSR